MAVVIVTMMVACCWCELSVGESVTCINEVSVNRIYKIKLCIDWWLEIL